MGKQVHPSNPNVIQTCWGTLVVDQTTGGDSSADDLAPVKLVARPFKAKGGAAGRVASAIFQGSEKFFPKESLDRSMEAGVRLKFEVS